MCKLLIILVAKAMARRRPLQISLTDIEHERVRVRALGARMSMSRWITEMVNENWRNSFGSQHPQEVLGFFEQDYRTYDGRPTKRVQLNGGKTRKVRA